MQSRTRVLVTNQLHILSQCDRVIVLKNGAIVEMGIVFMKNSEGPEFESGGRILFFCRES
jgi:ABC-type methionine transport system ATPase subunit